ncbi:MAG: 16S rRNA (guanine(527)-N(7))-methyltransferase RsmG [Thermodesulforhabdaceae bacterium]|jgi:16S rRNA (guanine527-N7)-methyltransferase
MVISIPPAPPWFTEQLARYAQEAGIKLHSDQLELLKHHAEWVFFWNRVTNLTAARDWNELITKHYLDALIAAYKWLPKSGTMLDIGSGAGFPGIPIKILSPDLDVTLCEVRRKKASFLKSFIYHAGLTKIRVEQATWQEVLLKAKDKFDLITWRAIKIGFKDILEIIDRGVAKGGIVACWTTPSSIKKGDFPLRWPAEKSINSAEEIYGSMAVNSSVFFYSLPGGVERALVLFSRE